MGSGGLGRQVGEGLGRRVVRGLGGAVHETLSCWTLCACLPRKLVEPGGVHVDFTRAERPAAAGDGGRKGRHPAAVTTELRPATVSAVCAPGPVHPWCVPPDGQAWEGGGHGLASRERRWAHHFALAPVHDRAVISCSQSQSSRIRDSRGEKSPLLQSAWAGEVGGGQRRGRASAAPVPKSWAQA